MSDNKLLPIRGKQYVSISEVPCEHCKTPATFSTQVPPLGDEPGHRVYECQACKRFTWVSWSGWHSEVRQPNSPHVQQLQQQQPQKALKPNNSTDEGNV